MKSLSVPKTKKNDEIKLNFEERIRWPCSNLVYRMLNVECIYSVEIIPFREGSTELHMYE